MLEESKRILYTHKFDGEEENDITEDDVNFTSNEYTWLSKTKWKNLISCLEKALEILKVDSDADVYYHIWF